MSIKFRDSDKNQGATNAEGFVARRVKDVDRICVPSKLPVWLLGERPPPATHRVRNPEILLFAVALGARGGTSSGAYKEQYQAYRVCFFLQTWVSSNFGAMYV